MKIKAYTDIEQSKKLVEFLPIESADMYYDVNRDGIQGIPEILVGSLWKNNIPCWSLAALMNLLPSEFTEKGKYIEITYKVDIRKYALTKDVDVYQIAYGNYLWYENRNSSWKDMVNSGQKEELIDAVFQMICWLKENNKL